MSGGAVMDAPGFAKGSAFEGGMDGVWEGGWAPAPIEAQLPTRSIPGQSPYRDPDLENIRVEED